MAAPDGAPGRARLVPVTVVTGFLGAGKTTVVNALLAGMPGDGRTVVVCNEAGTASVATELGGAGAELVEVLGGCACCTLNLELIVRLAALARRADEIDRVILETSGVADPVPVLQAFQQADVRRAMRVLGVLAVVDPCGRGREADPWLWRRQVSIADRLVVSRADVATPAQLADLDGRLDEAAAPGAERRRVAPGTLDVAWALGPP
ncbi:CobW family GTP-binding protein, partial [Patulibacter sp. S7RM1-6]